MSTGMTRILGHDFDTTGFVRRCRATRAARSSRATFPSWLTHSEQPLAVAGTRQWRFPVRLIFGVSGLCYVLYAIWSRHLRVILRRPAPTWRSIGRSIIDHLRFHHPHWRGIEATKQRPAEADLPDGDLRAVAAGDIDGIRDVAGLDSVIPGWVNVVGGRQSARTIHFVVAWLLVLFVFIHVFEVIITGLWNNLRSMITGRYRVEGEAKR